MLIVTLKGTCLGCTEKARNGLITWYLSYFLLLSKCLLGNFYMEKFHNFGATYHYPKDNSNFFLLVSRFLHNIIYIFDLWLNLVI